MSLPESSRLSPFSSLAFFEVLGAHPFLTAKSMMKVPVHTAWDGRGRVRETGQREKKKRDSCVSVTVAQKPKMMSRTDKRGEEKGQLTMFSLDPMNPPLFKCSESQSQRIILFAAILARGAKLCEDGARASLGRNSRGASVAGRSLERERENDEGAKGRSWKGLAFEKCRAHSFHPPLPPRTLLARGAHPCRHADARPRRHGALAAEANPARCVHAHGARPCGIVCLSVRSRLPPGLPQLALAPLGKWDIQ